MQISVVIQHKSHQSPLRPIPIMLTRQVKNLVFL